MAQPAHGMPALAAAILSEPPRGHLGTRVASDTTGELELASLQVPGTNWNALAQDASTTRRLNDVGHWLFDTEGRRHATLTAGVGVTAGLTIGYVVWLVRGGVLFSSMLSALPVWQLIDPVPVAAGRRGEEDAAGESEGDRSAERLFDRRRGARRTKAASIRTPLPVRDSREPRE